MKTINFGWGSPGPRRRAIALALIGAALFSGLRASDTTDPVGVFRIRLRGNSDTIVSLPLQRPALLEASIAARTGNGLVLSATAPALPADGAFALVMSGALEGAVLPIASVSGSTLTIDPAGFELTPLRTTATHGATLADLVAIVPYWTLDTLFPQAKGVHVSATASQRSTEILVFDDSVAGINHSAAAIYYYFAGNGSRSAGWYQVGDTVARGQIRLPPNRYFVVRHKSSMDSSLDIMGGVQMAGFRVPLRTVAATDQDNIISIPVVQPLKLKDSKLIESGAFRVSSSASIRTDELLMFDNTVIGFNKSASAIYYYFVGSESRPAGWYQVGSMTLANDILLRPGQGYVVRKRKPAGPSWAVWNGIPPYLQ